MGAFLASSAANPLRPASLENSSWLPRIQVGLAFAFAGAGLYSKEIIKSPFIRATGFSSRTINRRSCPLAGLLFFWSVSASANLKVHTAAVGQLERVVAEIFGSLDVVLVGVCPVEFYFFALVGNCINPLFITPQ